MGDTKSKGKTASKDEAAGAEAARQWSFVERVLASPRARVMYLYGPPGVGKTYAAYELGRTGNGVFPITLTPEMTAAEVRGHFLPRGRDLVFHEGPFTRALRSGGRLVINEITHASGDVLALLYPVLESVETAQLMLPTDEIVRPAEGFHVVVTDNETPAGLPEALQDRFDCQIEITHPHPRALARLAPALRRAAERTFALNEDRRIGLRQWLAVDRFRGELGMEDACLAVFGAERGAQVYTAVTLAEGDTGRGGGGRKGARQ